MLLIVNISVFLLLIYVSERHENKDHSVAEGNYGNGHYSGEKKQDKSFTFSGPL